MKKSTALAFKALAAITFQIFIFLFIIYGTSPLSGIIASAVCSILLGALFSLIIEKL